MGSLSVLWVFLSRVVKCVCAVCVFILSPQGTQASRYYAWASGCCWWFWWIAAFVSCQAFYPVERPVDVSFGDILAARCVFTGEGRTEVTHIGYDSTDSII